MKLLNRRNSSSPVTLHGEDSYKGWHLEDQIPIMDNGHEPVQGRSANDGIEGEAHLRNIELNVLCAEVLLGPEHHRQGDGPHRIDRMRTHSGEWRDGSSLDSGIYSCLNAA